MATLTPTSGETWCTITGGKFSYTYDGYTWRACEFKPYGQTCLSGWFWNTAVNITAMNIFSWNYHMSNYSYIQRVYGRVNGSWVILKDNVKIHMPNKSWFKLPVNCDNCTGIRIATLHESNVPAPTIGEVSFDYVTAPPPPEEGKAVITNVEAPSTFIPYEPFNIVVSLRNDGGDDKLFVDVINKDTGKLLSAYSGSYPAGSYRSVSIRVIVPQETDFRGRLEAGHIT